SRPTSETRSRQGAIQPSPARAHASAAWGSVHVGIVAWFRLRRPSAVEANVKPRLRTSANRGSVLPPAPGRSATWIDLRFRAEVEDRLHRGPPFLVSRLGYALLHGTHELVPFPGPRVIVDPREVSLGIEAVVRLHVHEEPPAEQIDPHLCDADLAQAGRHLGPDLAMMLPVPLDQGRVIHEQQCPAEALRGHPPGAPC